MEKEEKSNRGFHVFSYEPKKKSNKTNTKAAYISPHVFDFLTETWDLSPNFSPVSRHLHIIHTCHACLPETMQHRQKYSTQHLGTKPKFYHGRFQRTYEEEVPCADYHVQAPAIRFFGGVYLKFKFSDLQILKTSQVLK